jgi:beta-propeller repeat-containing protein
MLRFHSRYYILAALALAASLSASAATTPEQQAHELLSHLPLYFEANQGQVASEVRYLSRSPEHTLFLTDSQAVLKVGSGVLTMRLQEGNSTPAVQAVDKRKSFGSYFVGKKENWIPRVEHFDKVRYVEVYPGIDLEFYGKGRQIEHDFIVAPGSDPATIRFRLSGADVLQIEDDGDLGITIGETKLRFSAPYSYMRSGAGRVEVASRFVRTGEDEFGFAVDHYDRSKTLVIDPVLSYSTYFGGSNYEIARDVAIDSTGHIIVAGVSSSEDYPTNGPPLQGSGGDAINGFVLRLNPFAGAGQGMAFSGIFGGVQNESVNALALDSMDNIYIVGGTASGDFPTTDNAVQNERPFIDDNAYLIKFDLNADPLLQYGTYLGGEGRDEAYGLAVDADQRAYVTGLSAATEFPLTSTALQASDRGAGDAFFTLVDTVGGGLIYSTYLGGTNSDFGTDVAFTSNNEAWVTGFTNSGDFPINGNPYQSGQQGGGDAFLTRIDWTKNGLDGLGYSTHLGGAGLDYGNGLVRDPDGTFHILGYTLSDNFPTTAAAIQRANAGNADVFLATLDPTKPGGEGLVYSTYYGGDSGDVPYKMQLDSSGGLIIAGYTLSSDLAITGDYYSNSYGGLTDGFFARIDPEAPNGEGLTCSSFFGGSLQEVIWGMAIDNLDNYYFVGQTRSIDFPVTDNALNNQKPGIVSAFVSKFSPCTTPGESGTTSDTRRTGGTGQGRPVRGGGRGR